MPIQVIDLFHTYGRGTPFARPVLFGVNLAVRDGEILGIIGPSKAGKSTLAQYLNGLFVPARGAGTVVIDGIDTADRCADIGAVRRRVGLIFQYPEDQLFEPTVERDVGFAPRQQGLPAEEVRERVRLALDRAGLPYEEFAHRHTHALSGGQKRRVAIAGVLVMEPRVLVLDEPTAGLDPRGREEIVELILRTRSDLGLAVVVVSSNLEEVARLAERVAVLADGRVRLDGGPREVFTQVDQLRDLGLPTLKTVALMAELRARGLDVRIDCLTVDEVCDELAGARDRLAAAARG